MPFGIGAWSQRLTPLGEINIPFEGWRVFLSHSICKAMHAHKTGEQVNVPLDRDYLQNLKRYQSQASDEKRSNVEAFIVMQCRSKDKWQLCGSNPRPFGLALETSALDHSAELRMREASGTNPLMIQVDALGVGYSCQWLMKILITHPAVLHL